MANYDIDVAYCASSFLQFRTIADRTKAFSAEYPPRYFEDYPTRTPINTSEELADFLRSRIAEKCGGKPVALALSGGADSAILARYVPEGSVAYTFKCVVPGQEVTDETGVAARYAEECGLEQRVVEIYWEDMEELAPELMKRKGTPIHSIEVQICKAARQAVADGFTHMVFGESADVVYGGFSQLLSKDWTFGDFVERYSHVMPYKALKDHRLVLEPYRRFEQDGMVDPHKFVSEFFRIESMGSYTNALECAGITPVCPFSETYLAHDINYSRVRAGENKYLVREVFDKEYPGWGFPAKTPMPRPVDQWLETYEPTRGEFWPHCTSTMTGDQKWLVWAVEKFLDIIEGKA